MHIIPYRHAFIITSNYIVNVGVTSWFSAQLIKTVLTFLQYRELRAERLFGAGGMPSSHSALVWSLALAAAKSYGFNSPIFALSFVLAGIVMYDAMGVRRETGEQAKILNKMIADWLSEGNVLFVGENGRALKEKVGHTPFEVIAGALLGLLIAALIPVF